MHSSVRLWRLRKAIAAVCSASPARPPRVITGLPRAGHALLTGTRPLAGKTWCAMRILTASGVGALVVLCALRRHDLATAAGAVPPQALGALAALHLASLVARSEAWRLSLAALVGAPPSRAAIHAANAGAFVAGALEPHAALPARVALLRRLAPHHLPHPTHVAVADLPILLLEAAGAAVLLGATGMWGAPAAALALLLGARLAAGRRATRGLAVLADVRRRTALALLVGCVVGCGLARVWLVLAVARLDASPAAAALAFAALGIFGLLPLGPSAPPGALLLVSGGAGAGALGAGLALSATSLAAVALYGAVLWLASRALRHDGSQPRFQPVELEGPEAAEDRVGGAMEVGRAGGQEVALGAARGDERGLLGVVGRVEGLDAVEPERREAVDGLEHRLGRIHVPERMGPHGDAAGLVDEGDGLGHGRLGPPPVGRGAGDQIGPEQLRGVHDLLAREAHPVGGMIEGGLGEMRTAERGPLGDLELEPARAQGVGHAPAAGGPIGTELGQRLEQARGAVVEQVAEEVEVLPVAVERRELDRGDHAEAVSRARLERLVDAVHRVMVGERQQLHPRLGGGRNHSGRR